MDGPSFRFALKPDLAKFVTLRRAKVRMTKVRRKKFVKKKSYAKRSEANVRKQIIA